MSEKPKMTPKWKENTIANSEQISNICVTTCLDEPNDTNSLFPQKLRKLLNDAESQGKEWIVSWLPHGNSFQVHRRDLFLHEILPRHFNQKCFKSFQRQLYLYGFERIKHGPQRGGYFHPLFKKCDWNSTAKIQRIDKGIKKKRNGTTLRESVGMSSNGAILQQSGYENSLSLATPSAFETTYSKSNSEVLLQHLRIPPGCNHRQSRTILQDIHDDQIEHLADHEADHEASRIIKLENELSPAQSHTKSSRPSKDNDQTHSVRPIQGITTPFTVDILSAGCIREVSQNIIMNNTVKACEEKHNLLLESSNIARLHQSLLKTASLDRVDEDLDDQSYRTFNEKAPSHDWLSMLERYM